MKEIWKKIKLLNKTINKLMYQFCDLYQDIFTKKNLITYQDVVTLDYEINKTYLDFCMIITETNFNIETFRFVNNNYKIIFNNLMNAEQVDIDQIINNRVVDGLYYSYILCQMYIIMPLIMYDYLLKMNNVDKITDKNKKIKKEYKIYSTKLAIALEKNLSVFKKWDNVENTVNAIPFDDDEKIELLDHTCYKTHLIFKQLFLNYFLVDEWFLNSTKLFTFMNKITDWKFMLIIVGIIIVIIALVIVAIIININK